MKITWHLPMYSSLCSHHNSKKQLSFTFHGTFLSCHQKPTPYSRGNNFIRYLYIDRQNIYPQMKNRVGLKEFSPARFSFCLVLVEFHKNLGELAAFGRSLWIEKPSHIPGSISLPTRKLQPLGCQWILLPHQ